MSCIKIRKVFILLTAFFVISCSPTHEEGDGSSSSSDPSVLAFTEHLYPLITTECSICHNSQPPTFGTSSAESSHNTLISGSWVSLGDPGNSGLVLKLEGGHQGFTQTDADNFEAAIAAWASDVSSAVISEED